MLRSILPELKNLVNTVSSDGYCKNDIGCRTAMGQQAFMNKNGFLTGKLNLDFEKRGL